MATFAIPIDRAATEPKAVRRFLNSDGRFAATLVTALTFFAILVHGYHPYAEDGGLYLAGVERLLDPALFPHGTAFVLEPTRLSVFAPAIAALVRATHLGLAVVVFGVHVISVWVTLFAAWMLACRCWASRPARAGAVVLLACWLSLPVAGTALVWMDPYLTARSFSTPCMVLALVWLLDVTSAAGISARRNSLLRCIAALVVAAAMHPLMGGYAIFAAAILGCVRSASRGVRLGGIGLIVASAIGAAAILQATGRPESAEYARVALTRTYWFPAAWSWYEWIGLIAPLAILGFFAMRQSDTQSVRPATCPLARMAFVSGVTGSVVAILFAHAGSSSHLVARLQPLRVFHIVYLVMVLLLGAKLGEALKWRLWRWSGATALLAGIMFFGARNSFPDSPHLELPGTVARNPWVEAFVWIRDHTPRDAVFALDPDYINSPQEDAQCFRAIAERSALADYSKDGGEASIAPDLTEEWVAGQRGQQGLNAAGTTDDSRLAALTPLGVTWVVLNAPTPTDLDCPYSNSAVKVCRLR